MNEKNLARVTVVLSRRTADQLRSLSHRFGVSASALVREAITEPVEIMAAALSDVSDRPTKEDAERFGQQMLEFADVQLEEMRVEVGKGVQRRE